MEMLPIGECAAANVVDEGNFGRRRMGEKSTTEIRDQAVGGCLTFGTPLIPKIFAVGMALAPWQY